MGSIKVRQRIGEDGILHIEIPIGLADKEVDVTIVYQPVQSLQTEIIPLEQLYGICADDLIILDEQGISESLDEDLAGSFD